jgi:hypothetical protein
VFSDGRTVPLIEGGTSLALPLGGLENASDYFWSSRLSRRAASRGSPPDPGPRSAVLPPSDTVQAMTPPGTRFRQRAADRAKPCEGRNALPQTGRIPSVGGKLPSTIVRRQ